MIGERKSFTSYRWGSRDFGETPRDTPEKEARRKAVIWRKMMKIQSRLEQLHMS
jgi:hypothetical protein